MGVVRRMIMTFQQHAFLKRDEAVPKSKSRTFSGIEHASYEDLKQRWLRWQSNWKRERVWHPSRGDLLIH